MVHKNLWHFFALIGQFFVYIATVKKHQLSLVKQRVYIMEAIIKYEDGVILAEKNFAEIKAKGKKYVERNAPKYLREALMVPFYITRSNGKEYLHIIHPPSEKRYEKIFFKKFLINTA